MSPGDTNQDVRERWRRIKRVAGEAVDLPGDARAAYIEEQCASDERLAADVRALVASIRRLPSTRRRSAPPAH
jgi:hypothetical protein